MIGVIKYLLFLSSNFLSSKCDRTTQCLEICNTLQANIRRFLLIFITLHGARFKTFCGKFLVISYTTAVLVM